MQKPKISVLIPVYNAGLYLSECLDSLMSQPDVSVEIICVDDGSTDNSLNILNESAARDSRIKVIAQKNQGAAIARNNAINIATGEFLWFIDADDFVAPNALEKIADFTNLHPEIDALIFAARIVADNKITTTPTGLYSSHFIASTVVDAETVAPYLFSSVSPTPWNKVFNASFIKDNKVRFQNLSSCNDVAFVKTAIVLANKIGFMEREILYYYREDTVGAVSSNRGNKVQNIIAATQQAIKNIEKHPNYKLYKKDFLKSTFGNIRYEMYHCNDRQIMDLLRASKQVLPTCLYIKLAIKVYFKKFKRVIGRGR